MASTKYPFSYDLLAMSENNNVLVGTKKLYCIQFYEVIATV
jgi:hypothetical protein